MKDYGIDEAWKCAISKRKYLLDTALEAFEPKEMGGGSSQNLMDDDDEPHRKTQCVNIFL